MPEIYECLFGLAQLFKCFSNNDKKFEQELDAYEAKTLDEMAQIRLNLFKDYGYKSEFERAFQ